MVPSHLYCTVCGAANQAEDAFCFACGGPLRSTAPSPQYPVSASALSTSTGLLPSNHLLKQRYRVMSQLGKGGFGAVYQAEDNQFGNRLLAVKEMSQSGLSPQEIIEATDAFKREAHLLASLKHPNLPSIYDYFNEAKRWYLVMDFIEGETLEEHLNKEKEGRLPWEEALQIGIQLCTVLGYLHRRQPPIIFRDLKPANVMLTPEGHLYLIDFGIARHFKPGQMRDTMAFGSPGRGIKILIMQMVEMDESKRPESVDTIKQKLQRIAATKQKTSRLAPTQVARQISFPQPGVPIQSAPPSDPLPSAQTSTSGVSQKTKKQWLDTSNDLYNAKRYQDALYACEQALRNDPDNADVYNLKGDVLSDLKRYGEALTAFERAIQLDPNSATAYKNKGVTLKNLKHYEEALAAYERAIQLDPTLASAYGNKVVALMHLERYEEAMAACEQAFQLGLNSAVALANKGSILFALKRHEGALATLEQAIQLDPGNAEIYNHKGIMLHELKRFEEALTAFERAIQLGPNLAITYSNKGNTLVMLKRYEEALAALERALLLDPNLVAASNLIVVRTTWKPLSPARNLFNSILAMLMSII